MDRRKFLSLAGVLPILPATFVPAGRRILVIGDSVTWGQGLRDSQKMHTLLARQLYAKDGLEPTVLHYACSGATIGYKDHKPAPSVEVPGWWPREIPESDPTLYEQCLQVNADHLDRRFDLIILAGGINDVSVQTIFNPMTSVKDIQTACQTWCYGAMSDLLGFIRSTYVSANPQVRVMVLGYYSVFSSKSHLPDIADLLETFVIELINPPTLEQQRAAELEVGPLDLAGLLIRNSTAFRDESLKALDQAVTDANAKGGANFTFVDPHHGR